MVNTKVILRAENISKQYRLGLVGSGTLSDDLKRWWYNVRGKEDPFLKVGAVNDRSANATEDYVWALRDINFEVNHGEVLGIIGKNGAGKSTLLKILSRVTAPTTGSIKTKGRIASLLEVGTGFHGELTGRENIFMNGTVLGMTKAEIKSKLDEIIAFSGCEKYIDTPVKRYSSGMTVRLGFAVAAHLEPEILVVDEVLAVGDAEFQKKAIGKMQDLSTGEGRTVLFVSHNMTSVKTLCTRAIVLGDGLITYEGDSRSSVDHYLSHYRQIPKNISILDDTHRRYKTTKEFQLVRIVCYNKNLFVRTSANFDILIRKNIEKIEEICLTGTVFNTYDVEVGSFFTEKFIIDKNEQNIHLTLTNPNLSTGEYYLNLSISRGNISESNLEVVDHAYEAIGFEVQQEKEVSHFIKWEKSWGSIHFQSTIKIGAQQ